MKTITTTLLALLWALSLLTSPARAEAIAGEDLSYQLGSGDMIRIQVYGENDLTLEASQGQYDYVNDLAPQVGVVDTGDNDYTQVLAGVTWEAAGKTDGTLKVGRAEKNFTDADREDFAGNSWYGEIKWKPRTYSNFRINPASRAEEPPTGRGDYVDVTEWGIDWRHEWSDRIASRIRYLQIDEIYKGDPEGREDTSILYGFDVDYAMRRWLVFGLFFTQDDHQSNLEEFDYPHSVAGLTVRASL